MDRRSTCRSAVVAALVLGALVTAPVPSQAGGAGAGMSSSALKCARAISKGGTAAAKTRLGLCTACEIAQGKGKLDAMIDCTLEDARDLLPRALAKADDGIARACSTLVLDELARTSCGSTVGEIQQCLRTEQDPGAQAICRAVHGATSLGPDDKAARKCQRAVAKAMTSYALAIASFEGKCLEAALRSGVGLDACGFGLPSIVGVKAKSTVSITNACSDDVVAGLALCSPPVADRAEALARVFAEVECRAETLVALQFGRPLPDCAHVCTEAETTTTTTTTSATSTSVAAVTTTIVTSTSTTSSTSTTTSTLAPSCGDGEVNRPSEVCDVPDDRACPQRCRTDCTCAPACTTAPVITAVAPLTGDVGTEVVITGSGFVCGDPPAVRLACGGVTMIALSLADGEIRSVIPPGASDCRIEVVTDGGTSTAPADFDVVPSADFALSIVPEVGTVLQEDSTTFTVSVGGIDDLAQLVELETGPLPLGISVTLSQPAAAPGSAVTVEVRASNEAVVGVVPLLLIGKTRIDGVPVSRTITASVAVQEGARTGIRGRTVFLHGPPMAGVQLMIAGQSTVTDAGGNFLFVDLPAGAQSLKVIATAVDPRLPMYGVDVVLRQGEILELDAFNILPPVPPERFTPIDNATQDQVITDPSAPGAEFIIPAGVTIIGWDNLPRDKIAVTKLLPDELPVPPPPGPTRSFYQPSFGTPMGGVPSSPIPVRLPNDAGLKPGQKAELWAYFAPPVENAPSSWQRVGMGTVTEDGSTVVSDPGVGIPYFCGVCGLVCILNNLFGQPNSGNSPQDGDPVDLALGQMTVEKTDLVLNGRIPAVVRRHFNPYEPFSSIAGFDVGMGPGWALSVQVVLLEESPSLRRLVLPGNQRHAFTLEGDGAFRNQGSPSFRGAVLSGSRAGGYVLRFKNGTEWRFGATAAVAGIYLLTEQTDRNGNSLVVERDGNGRIRNIVEPAGRALSVTYTANRITQIQDPIGRIIRYGYDGSGRLSTVADPAGGVTRYVYDGAGRIVSITDARNIMYITNEYDALGRVARQVQADGGVWTFEYVRPQCPPGITCGADTGPSSVVVTDPRGYRTTRRLSPEGFLLEIQDALGATTTFARDASGHMVGMTDALGRSTRLERDLAGNLIGVVDAAGNRSRFELDSVHDLPRRIVDALGNATVLGYDARGNVIAVTDPAGARTELTYDARGHVITVTDPVGSITRSSYDPVGNLVTTIDPAGGITRRGYDVVSRLVSLTDPRGRTLQLEYDVLDRIVAVVDPTGSRTDFAHDANGNLLMVRDANGNIIEYEYDLMDRQVSRTDPLGRTETWTYDPLGNPVLHRDRQGVTTSFSYDALNRLATAAYADGSRTSYSYDATGRLTEAADSVAGTVLNRYDPLGRLMSQSTPEGAVAYQYDAIGRVVRVQVRGLEDTVELYDAASRVVRSTRGSREVELDHDVAGRRTTLRLPDGLAVDYAYDEASRLVGLTYSDDGVPIGQINYGYDATGNRSSAKGSALRGHLPAPVAHASYDAANRQLGFGETTMAYDGNGKLVVSSSTAGSRSYEWDDRGRLVSIADPLMVASFGYDAFGRRVMRNENGRVTRYLHDGQAIASETVDGLTSSRWNGPSIDEVWARDSEVFLVDALNSVVEVRDPTGQASATFSYGPFGGTRTSGAIAGSTLGFAGRELDATELYHNRARYWSPATARFISEDPLDIRGGDLNLYAYALNTPVLFTDPSGLHILQDGWNKAKEAFNTVRETFPLSTDDFFDCLANQALGAADGAVADAMTAQTITKGPGLVKLGTKAGLNHSGLTDVPVEYGRKDLRKPCRTFGSILYTVGTGGRSLATKASRRLQSIKDSWKHRGGPPDVTPPGLKPPPYVAPLPPQPTIKLPAPK